ncbi:MAG: sigma-70 family RNA polymerase sigma factor [Euzebyaceae bacterium]|nr:sigma-70 family RNA polymerase sigma factor [Euzebyaceae bacterium]
MRVGGSEPANGQVHGALQVHGTLVELTPLIRGVIAARMRDPGVVDDLVQETLARVMTTASRLDDGALAPYAVVVARNLVNQQWRTEERARRHAHRFLDPAEPHRPEDDVLRLEENQAVTSALARLSQGERQTLLAHELEGRATAEMAAESGSTTGAVAAQLHRTRAKLRVEYLLALEQSRLPSHRCRPVLLALSGGDRRRQRELDAAGHLLECQFCSQLSGPLLDRLQADNDDEEALLPIQSDKDVVVARQRGREIAAQIGFSPTDLTLIATAISEIARNAVRFADRGQMRIRTIEGSARRGVVIVARDRGPGIPDVQRALEDGYSTYGGMGLGLPGASRLMDELHIVSELGKGTTITMTKWCTDP